MTQRPESVAIVGGGIIGLSSAHFLSEAGLKVTVIDQGRVGGACSHGNCGLVNPSHVFPLPRPGAVRKAISAMLQPNAPFRIKPTLDFGLYLWFMKFASRGKLKYMREAGWGRHRLLSFSRQFYHDFIIGNDIDCDFEEKGCLLVYEHQSSLDEQGKWDAILRKEYGVGAELIPAGELEKMEPAFNPGVVAGAWYYPQDAHLRADRLIAAWRKKLEEGSVEFREQTKLIGLEKSGDRVTGVRLQPAAEVDGQNEEILKADAFVVATGAWTPFLNQELGCKISIQPGKGYSLTMPRPKICPRYPMILEDTKVAITPMGSGYRIGSTMEFAGYDTSINPKRLELLRDGATKYLKDPLAEPIEEEWYGWRPMTPTGLPIISPTPRYENLVVAAGHNMIGIMTAPGTGRLVSDLIRKEEPVFDPAPYAIR